MTDFALFALATGWRLNLQSTPTLGREAKRASHTKFTCPGCSCRARGKPSLIIACIPCGLPMISEHPASEVREAA
jgi:hypothetical protein